MLTKTLRLGACAVLATTLIAACGAGSERAGGSSERTSPENSVAPRPSCGDRHADHGTGGTSMLRLLLDQQQRDRCEGPTSTTPSDPTVPPGPEPTVPPGPEPTVPPDPDPTVPPGPVPTSAPPAPSTTGLDGLYLGSVASLTTPGDRLDEWFHFLPDGHYVQGHPGTLGLVGFDFAGTAAAWPDWVGTYTVDGTTVTLTSSTGTTGTMTIDGGCGGLYRSYSASCYPAVDDLDGLRPVGRYEVLYEQDYGRYAGIEFFADGTFQETGALAETNWATEAWDLRAPFEANPSGSGTYEFVDNTLRLQYSDGRHADVFAYQLEPDTLYLADDPFTKV